ncbi:hypothetical protein BJ085DRAFT_35558 [Dimargaris cristalligena]|uniref:RRM domain-containing protein n=1 Tax=Dimargaris cristalligena TaxID=215637 RepID=A0A4P9ZPS3_9FUNG|nr:hypothetical protein BJ085DRAFT_35558 [Dimargaris cristalligena]|eukprot:RKP34701.1 hypothetical protein BJ085DRAFT_35558 [Dimargaris cristalligena]
MQPHRSHPSGSAGPYGRPPPYHPGPPGYGPPPSAPYPGHGAGPHHPAQSARSYHHPQRGHRSMAQAPPSTALVVERSTTLYIGSISEGISDNWVERLLVACGPLKSWKRTADQNGNPKGFGFAEYENAESTLRALRVLGNEPDSRDNPPPGSGTTAPASSAGIQLPSLKPEAVSKHLVVKADDKTRAFLNDAASRQAEGESQAEADTKARAEIKDILARLHALAGRGGVGGMAPSPLPQATEEASAPPTNAVAAEQPKDSSPPDSVESSTVDFLRNLSAEIGSTASVATPATPVDATPQSARESASRKSTRSRSRSYSHSRSQSQTRSRSPSRERGRPRTISSSSVALLSSPSHSLKKRYEAEQADAFNDRERRFLRRERKRLHQLEHDLEKLDHLERKKETDAAKLQQRLANWDEEEERASRKEDYYYDRERWWHYRKEKRENELAQDAKDRAAEEKERLDAVAVVEESAPKPASEGASVPLASSSNVADAVTELPNPEETADSVSEVAPTAPSLSADDQLLLESLPEDLRTAQSIQIIQSIPESFDELQSATVTWDKLSEGALTEHIEPFIRQLFVQYLGEGDSEAVDELLLFIIGHLKGHQPAAGLIEELEMALDEDTPNFVRKLWRRVLLETQLT